MYHSEETAKLAEDYFIKTFSKKEIPDNLPEFKPESGEYDLISILIKTELASSKSDAGRIIEQGGVKVDGVVIIDPHFIVPSGATLQKGKLKFLKIG